MTIFEQRNFQATEPGVKGRDEYQDKKSVLSNRTRMMGCVFSWTGFGRAV